MVFFDNVPAQFQALAEAWNAGVFNAMAQIDAISAHFPAQWSEVIRQLHQLWG
ncbi:hypothetical protein GP475_04225 [Corynebacterium poyangense]|uniref:Uncharacterized protein n=1 Tax=Corynebacterium poyangense TaxID=2684405 RepID=A0A7H0SN12_9CORY|nr:hypothetical protein [Corynebacterium poyangense]MBZ8176950.1 hypothetical protein [Corynebacterium poyangense]QNQ89937.1 hypothetical protein GP475_04225 [Corynebacterium poyangense]